MAVLFCFLNIAVKYLGKPRHWLIVEQSVLADAFTYVILQLEPHKTQIWSVFFFEWLSPEMRMWIITLWKQTLYNHFPQEQFLTEKDTWSRCEGKDTRVKWKSRSSPQRLRRIYPSGGKVSRKINGLNKPGRMSHLSEGELHVEKYLSCESFDKVVVKGTRFPKKLRKYCLGKAEWKCKSGD